MATKLTLTVDEQIVKEAKSYAKQTGRSLSEIVENYLAMLVADDYTDKGISHKLKKLVGAVNLPNDFDEKKEILKYLERKHL